MSARSLLPEMLCAPDTLNLPSGLVLSLCDLDLAELGFGVQCTQLLWGGPCSAVSSVRFRLEGKGWQDFSGTGANLGAMIVFWGEMWWPKITPITAHYTQQPQLLPRVPAEAGQSLCRPLASPHRIPTGGGSRRCKCAQPPFF